MWKGVNQWSYDKHITVKSLEGERRSNINQARASLDAQARAIEVKHICLPKVKLVVFPGVYPP